MTKKNILILSHGDSRGDGIAAYETAKYLIEDGYNVIMMVLHKTRTDAFIIQPTLIYPKLIKHNLFYRVWKKIYYTFFLKPAPPPPVIKLDNKYDFFINQEVEEQFSDESILNSLPFIPDLIFACTLVFLANTTTLAALKNRTNAEVYMAAMDMAPFTGGCQHAWDCKGYQLECKNCPAILDEEYKDIAHKNLMIKLNNVKNHNLKVIVGSGRLYQQAKSATLFKDQKIIYNTNSGINTKDFNANHRQFAKQIFNLPADAKVIFAGAEYTDNERKGIKYFIDALIKLWSISNDDIKNNTLVLIASKAEKSNDLIDKIPFKKVMINFITDDRLLSLAYQAADIFVCPSVEDPGPRMVSQALACGTPVAGFEMGVLTNMVINGYNGYKAKLRDTEDLCKGLYELLSLNEKSFSVYSNNAIKQVEQYSSVETFLNIIHQIFKEIPSLSV